MGRVIRARKFFSMKGGRIGLGPENVEPNDIICVLYYGGQLFVLRVDDVKDTAKLIVEAYVDEITSGVAVSMLGRDEDKEFILR